MSYTKLTPRCVMVMSEVEKKEMHDNNLSWPNFAHIEQEARDPEDEE